MFVVVFFHCSHALFAAIQRDDTWKVRLCDSKWHDNDTLWAISRTAFLPHHIHTHILTIVHSSLGDGTYLFAKVLAVQCCCLSSFFILIALVLFSSCFASQLFACQSNLSYHICDFHFCVGIFIFPPYIPSVIHLPTKINWYESGKRSITSAIATELLCVHKRKQE